MATPSAFADKLRRLDSTQSSISATARYMALMAGGAGGDSVLAMQASVLDAALLAAPPPHTLELIYLINEVLHLNRPATPLHTPCAACMLPPLRRSFALVAAAAAAGCAASASVAQKLARLAGIWGERKLLSSGSLAALERALASPHASLREERDGETLLARAGSGAGRSGSGSSGGSSGPNDALPGETAAASSPALLEAELRAAGEALGQAPLDGAAALRGSEAGRARDDALRLAVSALASLEKADVLCRMAGEDASALPALLRRAFVLEADGGARGASATPLTGISQHLAAAEQQASALRNEKRARTEALGAISSLLQALSSGGAEGVAAAEARLSGVRAVRMRLEGAVAAAAVADAAAAAATALAAPGLEEGEEVPRAKRAATSPPLLPTPPPAPPSQPLLRSVGGRGGRRSRSTPRCFPPPLRGLLPWVCCI